MNGGEEEVITKLLVSFFHYFLCTFTHDRHATVVNDFKW